MDMGNSSRVQEIRACAVEIIILCDRVQKM